MAVSGKIREWLRNEKCCLKFHPWMKIIQRLIIKSLTYKKNIQQIILFQIASLNV